MRESPMVERAVSEGAIPLEWGPPETGARVIAALDELELEYAAIRRSAAVIDRPNRGVLEVRGGDRASFLDRMLTQELKGMRPGDVRASFWLTRQGRIDADVRVIALEDRVLLELDVNAAARTVAGLGAFVIADDVQIEDVTERTHRVGVHGPGAADRVRELGLALPTRAGEATGDPAAALVFRDDECGVSGYELIVPMEGAAGAWDRLVAAPEDSPRPPRAIGWLAYNVARLEAGTPLFNVDFGPTTLPHESGVLDRRVSFTKGCYLGQEVVARMQSRGRWRASLVALRFEVPAGAGGDEWVPESGGAVLAGGVGVGAITSSASSPMLGAVPIALASVKSDHAAPGTRLSTRVRGGEIVGVVQPTLAFVR